jgi:hypothetical protein
MAIRNTTHVLKNSDIVNRPLPSSLLKGEPIVNTADGIVFFSGFTTSTAEWTPAGTGTTANFFEVGSNLYDLRLRNQITKYQDQTGSGLVGKFLSGTTSGFVLADITDIAASVDSYTTGATWSPNVLTIELNNGKPAVPVTIDSFTALTINGNLNVTGTEVVNNLTITGTGLYNTTATGSSSLEIVNYGSLTAFSQTNDVYVTGNTLTPSTNDTPTQSAQLDYHGTPIGGPYFITTQDTFTTGGTYNNGNKLITFVKNDSTSYTVDLSTIDTNDTYVTGGTNTAATDNTSTASIGLLYNQDVAPGTYTLPYTNVYTTGGTYNSGTEALDFTRNDGVVYSVSLSGIDINDTYVTGFTYSPTTNTFTISQNEGQPDLVASINTVSGLSFSNLTQGRVVYVGPGGLLTDESTFTYNDGTNTLSVDNIDAAGNVVIQGDLTVLGAAISAFTSNLYVEDPNITLNYNPTGSTIATSVNAGFTIQDGNGIAAGDVNFDIVRMQNLTGLTGTEVPSVTEYTALTGYPNRGWVTQLNDIVIRSTDPTDDGSFNGVRVLAEFDVLDGGSY